MKEQIKEEIEAVEDALTYYRERRRNQLACHVLPSNWETERSPEERESEWFLVGLLDGLKMALNIAEGEPVESIELDWLGDWWIQGDVDYRCVSCNKIISLPDHSLVDDFRCATCSRRT